MIAKYMNVDDPNKLKNRYYAKFRKNGWYETLVEEAK